MALLFPQEIPSVIDQATLQDKRRFRFDKILKKVVDKYGEEILEDPGIVDVIDNIPNESVHPDVLHVLEHIIADKAVNYLIDHESNSWDEDTTQYYIEYAKKKNFNREFVESIARCIAYSLDMEVEIKPFRSLVKKKLSEKYNSPVESQYRPLCYNLDEVERMITVLPSANCQVQIYSVRGFLMTEDKVSFDCNVGEVFSFTGDKTFFIHTSVYDDKMERIWSRVDEVVIEGPIGKEYCEPFKIEIDKDVFRKDNVQYITINISRS